MVHKFVDPCSREHIWYKGNTNFQKWKKIIKEKTYEK
jgi:hypothetical protein